MNDRRKTLLITVISASSLLAVAGIIFLVLAITLKWDILGGLSSPMAILIYILIALGLAAGAMALIKYMTNGRYK